MTHPSRKIMTCLVLALVACAVGPGTAWTEQQRAERPKHVRINCGFDQEHLDEEGNVWIPDTPFWDSGKTVNRGEIRVTYTTIPSIYRTERYFFPPEGSNRFEYPLPPGRYLVRMHFAETHVVPKRMRIQTVTVENKKIENIDIVDRAGGVRMALVLEETVEVNDGHLTIVIRQTAHDSALINGIEIIAVE